MLLFYKEKLVILAQPKTGTTALEAELRTQADMAIVDPPRLKHTSARRFRRNVEPWLSKDGAEPIETFALIREPIDWLGSWYRYRHRPQLIGDAKSTRGISFDDFVDAWLSEERPDFARIGSQARFVTGGRGRVLVTHLFQYEAYDAARAFLSQRLGRAITPSRMNVSPKLGLALSPDTEARLRADAAAEFRIWSGARRN